MVQQWNYECMKTKNNIKLILAALLLLFVNANALIVNIDGHGDIPDGGMEITVTDAELDILSGKMQMKLQGSLLCTAPLTVQITRSSTGLEDEFCCAGNCLSGNGETAQTLNYSPEGIDEVYAVGDWVNVYDIFGRKIATTNEDIYTMPLPRGVYVIVTESGQTLKITR